MTNDGRFFFLEAPNSHTLFVVVHFGTRKWHFLRNEKEKKPITIPSTHTGKFWNGPNGLFIIFYYFIFHLHIADTPVYANWNNETNNGEKKNDPKEKLKSINYFNKSMNHLCIFLLCTRTYGTQLKRSSFLSLALSIPCPCPPFPLCLHPVLAFLLN